MPPKTINCPSCGLEDIDFKNIDSDSDGIIKCPKCKSAVYQKDTRKNNYGYTNYYNP